MGPVANKKQSELCGLLTFFLIIIRSGIATVVIAFPGVA